MKTESRSLFEGGITYGKVYQNVTELIGHTPLLEVQNIESELGLKAKILVKLELFNPAGSVKDRVAKNMVEEAERQGILKRGGTIIEPTSGNTGIGLASIAASKGYRAIFTMPETMSVERRKLLQGYGAEIVLTDGKKEWLERLRKLENLQKRLMGQLFLVSL